MRPRPSDLEAGVPLPGSAPAVVEMAGAPGAGKTTGLPEVHASLQRAGWITLDPTKGAREVVSRTVVGRVAARIPDQRLRESVLWRIYLFHRLLEAVRALSRRPGYFLWLIRLQGRRPKGALARRRRVIYWYLRMLGAQQFYRRHARPGEAVVFDEGHVHRVVQLFSSPVDCATSFEVGRYLRGAPRPDLLVLVRCPADVCADRIRKRGVWIRLEDVADVDLDRYLENAERVVGHAIDQTRRMRWNVVEVENGSGDPASLASQIAASVGSRAPVPAEGRSKPLYRFVVPRPRQLSLLVRGRVGPPAVAPRTVDSFLAELGLSRRGRVSNLPLGRRSDSVRVHTEAGTLVVRAYREHWPDETLRHEHSLLVQLQKAGYPAARLVGAPGGETVVRCDGRRLAAYRYAPGRNLSGSFLSPAVTRETHHLSGRLLARLHRVTTDFEPEGRHHLRMDGTGADRLASQLELLHELEATEGTRADDWVRRRAGEVADRLSALHATLMGADLDIAVIHGDFGLHNLVVQRDGTPTVVDFELARRDWRLVDIVEALGSMSGAGAEAFLAGYTFEAGGEPRDWRHLAEMWQYHRLSGAVRSWESYMRRSEPERLEAARRRLVEADRVAREGVGAWR